VLPYTIRYVDIPIGVLKAVRYDHNASLSHKDQFFLVGLTIFSKIIFFSLLDILIWPLDCGWWQSHEWQTIWS